MAEIWNTWAVLIIFLWQNGSDAWFHILSRKSRFCQNLHFVQTVHVDFDCFIFVHINMSPYLLNRMLLELTSVIDFSKKLNQNWSSFEILTLSITKEWCHVMSRCYVKYTKSCYSKSDTPIKNLRSRWPERRSTTDPLLLTDRVCGTVYQRPFATHHCHSLSSLTDSRPTCLGNSCGVCD